jgi:hypothetical protein
MLREIRTTQVFAPTFWHTLLKEKDKRLKRRDVEQLCNILVVPR